MLLQVEYDVAPWSIGMPPSECIGTHEALMIIPRGVYFIYVVAHENTGGLGLVLEIFK